ncbi:GNAT family N-acetyltransferase [Brachyspira aalborgi]|uniref:GNAT family N-acetyltransferase n=1 Tax=Brachyspira aalborgi TaxID=29522 RepID=A0A5C8FZD8_9SPIR|nr:GNAT family N-acetyltransferase [Brachyspira aalborgi]TXJ41792.1 GNAT family N-acetyltransferase [Brachyspira aalborgi]TXJ55080.1 GNAT family N-acetyltransferase [Brachyspira aalborgi]
MNYIIREADIEDAENVIEYIKIVSDETDFLISDSSERNFTVRKEKEFLQNIQSSILEKIFLFEIENKIVGMCSIEGINKIRIKHRVDLAITVLKNYWGNKIGEKLIDYAIEYCKSNCIKKIELTVRIDNERALKLYKKFGFEIEGEIKNFIYLNGNYYNCYYMGLLL